MNLRAYASLSTVLAGLCVWRAMSNTRNVAQAMAYLISSKPSVLVLTNLAYVFLFGLGKLTQHLIFGKLRESERKKLNDRLLKYILFKIVFVGSILEISNMSVLLIWMSWFSVLGFFKLFSLLSRDRFEYLTTFKPNTPLSVHVRIFGLLGSILVLDALWFAASASIFGPAGLSVVLLMSFECITLFLSTIQTLIKYVIYYIDLFRKDEFWELRGTYTFYTELITESLILVATIGHYMHILYLHGLSCTLIHVVLFLHMRLAFQGLRSKIALWSNYRKMNADLNNRYPNVSPEELEQYNDSCAICLNHLSASAKKLPCGHIFHTTCLRSWLERNHSCPTCRKPLGDPAPNGQNNAAPLTHGTRPHNDQHDADDDRAYATRPMPPAQPLFQLQSHQLFDWLPGLRVQVLHRPRHWTGIVPDEWVRRVQEIFPDAPTEVITADLRRTRSVELTIDNFINNRIPMQPPHSATPGQEPAAENVGAPDLPNEFQTVPPATEVDQQQPSEERSTTRSPTLRYRNSTPPPLDD